MSAAQILAVSVSHVVSLMALHMEPAAGAGRRPITGGCPCGLHGTWAGRRPRTGGCPCGLHGTWAGRRPRTGGVLVVYMEPGLGLVGGLELGVFLWFTWNLGW